MSARKLTKREYEEFDARLTLVAESQILVDNPIKRAHPRIIEWLHAVLKHRCHEILKGRELPIKE